MSNSNRATALIADSEPALRTELERLLGEAWPELVVTASVGDGAAALEAVGRLQPDVAFLDACLPPPSGLEVARRVGAGTAIVFVTAYDNHAVEAFEYAAIDYLLKPVLWPRLQDTVRRVKRWLVGGGRSLLDPQTLASLICRLANAPSYLRWLQVGQRNRIEIVAVDDVCFFRSERKYTAVVTSEAEALIRTPIAELATQLDPEQFWRIHRGAIVNAAAIRRPAATCAGRYRLALKSRPEVLHVSATYAHLFRRM